MSLFSDLNFLATVLAFGTVSFAASNFGTKLGRVTGFQNRSGYEYVSSLDKEKSDTLYEAVVNTTGKNSSYSWAKDPTSLRQWCEKNQKRARKWQVTAEYCLIKNNVKHQLLKAGKKLLEQEAMSSVLGCNDELWNSYDDGTKSSKGYLFAVAKCIQPVVPSSQVNIQQGSSSGVQATQASGGSPAPATASTQ